jgi:hypothetical protein
MPRLPDWFTGLRLLLVPLVLWLGLAGQGRLVGVALVFAGLTDFLDGYLCETAPPANRSWGLAGLPRRQPCAGFGCGKPRDSSPQDPA